jgi:glycosyltransferase involved in cell wall biosynthesis
VRVAINALWRATNPSGICRHAAALARCLCLKADIERIYLLVGAWQAQYFVQKLQVSHRKLVIRCIDIANSAYARNRWYMYGLPKTAETVGAHLVHLSFPIPLNRRLLTKPVVTTLHDLYPYDSPANFGVLRVLGHRFLLKQCLQSSDRIACVSDFTRSRLAAVFGEELASGAARIYNCLELSSNCVSCPVRLRLSSRPFVLSVAQHRKNKNIELLLHAFAGLLAESVVTKDAALAIIGSAGPETRKIARAISQLNLKDHVILAHGVTDAELAWMYRNTLLTVCTSSVEGFGLPVAEAIQHGTRVVCSDIPAFREIGKENGTFFSLSEGDPIQNCVRACEEALQQPARPVSQDSSFSPETIAAQYLDLYSQLLRSKLAKAA